jgi:hypothetical protein
MAAELASTPPHEPAAFRYADGRVVNSLNSRFKVNWIIRNKTRFQLEFFWCALGAVAAGGRSSPLSRQSLTCDPLSGPITPTG